MYAPPSSKCCPNLFVGFKSDEMLLSGYVSCVCRSVNVCLDKQRMFRLRDGRASKSVKRLLFRRESECELGTWFVFN